MLTEKLLRKFSYAHEFWLIIIVKEIFVRAKKKLYVQLNPTQEVCEFGAQIFAFLWRL